MSAALPVLLLPGTRLHLLIGLASCVKAYCDKAPLDVQELKVSTTCSFS